MRKEVIDHALVHMLVVNAIIINLGAVKLSDFIVVDSDFIVVEFEEQFILRRRRRDVIQSSY